MPRTADTARADTARGDIGLLRFALLFGHPLTWPAAFNTYVNSLVSVFRDFRLPPTRPVRVP